MNTASVRIALSSSIAWWCGASSTAAHSEIRPTPDTVWFTWTSNPLFALFVLVVVWSYLRGTARLWMQAGKGVGIRRWQFASFLIGVGVFALARLSPIDAMGGALFSAHMVQHLLVFLIAPMLVAFGRPGLALVWALPKDWRRRVSHAPQSHPGLAMAWDAVNHWVGVFVLFAGGLWIWHVPALYDAALENHFIHDLEHFTFAAVSLLFWRRVIDAGRPAGIGYGAAFLLIFTTALHAGALGALLTFAPEPLYASHLPYTDVWGLSPLEDQQLAGVIMWIPMGFWFTVTALTLIAQWIRASDRSVRRIDLDEVTGPVEHRPHLADGRS